MCEGCVSVEEMGRGLSCKPLFSFSLTSHPTFLSPRHGMAAITSRSPNEGRGRTGLIVDGQTLWAGERNEERRELREETYAWRGRGTQSFGPPNIFVSSRRTSLSSLRLSCQSQCHIEKSFSRTIWPNLDLPGSWRRTRRQNPGLRSRLVRRLL